MTQLTDALLTSRPFILFENTLAAYANEDAWLFTQPVREIVAETANTLPAALAAIDEARQQGHYVAGYISYEAGYALSEKLAPLLETTTHSGHALLRFYAFDQVQRVSVDEITKALAQLPESPPYIQAWETAEAETDYVENLSRIHEYIGAGDTYQVNHTYRSKFELAGSIHGLYAALRERQPVAFSSLMHLPDCDVLSLSPELFVRKKGEVLSTKPMKGTAARGATEDEDAAILKAMRDDKKQQSENLMIVDLMRNDIGRLAKPGSMKVSNLFEIQTFKTLHQMISTIQGEVDQEITFADVINGLFPCGSITGAPKVRTMEIIHELENTPRGIYTGAIGFITPDNDFTFNVPIRTLTFPVNSQQGTLGIGGGIIYESDATDEWRESQLKARFLTGLNTQFKLIETFLFDGERQEATHLSQHLSRLHDSAAFFDIPVNIQAVSQAIQQHIDGIDQTQNHKIRILVDHTGEYVITSEVIVSEVNDTPPKVAISAFRIDAENLFRRHKTTNRTLYNDEYARYESEGFYDVLFLNQHGNIAEASRHNVFVEKDGMLYTPPIEDGALPGVMRNYLLKHNALDVIERSLTPAFLQSADKVYLSNSVRGKTEVSIVAGF